MQISEGKKMRDMSNVECYGCHKKGHFKRDCRATQSKEGNSAKVHNAETRSEESNNDEDNEPKEQRIASATRREEQTNPHGAMSWTACYDDDCRMHLGDKEGSGWFPTGPRISSARIGHMDLEETIIRADPLTPNAQRENENAEGSSEEGQSSEEDDDDVSSIMIETPRLENLDATITITAPMQMRQIIFELTTWNDRVFPRDSDGHVRIDPDYFHQMWMEMRSMMWHEPIVPTTYDHGSFVVELPPMGSTFTDEGYWTPQGLFVPRRLQEYTTQVKRAYRNS